MLLDDSIVIPCRQRQLEWFIELFCRVSGEDLFIFYHFILLCRCLRMVYRLVSSGKFADWVVSHSACGCLARAGNMSCEHLVCGFIVCTPAADYLSKNVQPDVKFTYQEINESHYLSLRTMQLKIMQKGLSTGEPVIRVSGAYLVGVTLVQKQTVTSACTYVTAWSADTASYFITLHQRSNGCIILLQTYIAAI